jgi:hypothetical protein
MTTGERHNYKLSSTFSCINMPDTTKITLYQFTKDILIPFLGVLSTIVIGIVIAFLLKSKEERAKIKALLIDNYMSYLEKLVQFHGCENKTFRYQTCKELLLNYERYFNRPTDGQLGRTQLGRYQDRLKEELDNLKQEDANWSPYTYKFAFLLGKKRYFKYLLPLENKIEKEYLNDKVRIDFVRQLIDKILNDRNFKENMISNDADKINDALDNTEVLVARSHNDFQFKYFNPFNTKLAELINTY